MPAQDGGAAVAAIGSGTRIAGFALAGVTVLVATTPDRVVELWDRTAPEAALVLLTQEAAAALSDRLERVDAPLWVVIPA